MAKIIDNNILLIITMNIINLLKVKTLINKNKKRSAMSDKLIKFNFMVFCIWKQPMSQVILLGLNKDKNPNKQTLSLLVSMLINI